MGDCCTTDLRTLLVGIDAGCFTVLEPLFEADAIPTLESIFESGASGELESQIPPWTASAWPSLYTGVNPGKHGVFGFLTFDGYDWTIVNSTNVREPTLWELLDHQDRTSVIVNVPVTHPAPEIDGAIVPGYVAPENPQCHPEGIIDDLREEIGEYRIYTPSQNQSVPDSQTLSELRDLTRMRGEAFRYLCDRYDPEFGFVQFQQTDTVLHEFPGDLDSARTIYEEVDDQLAAIIEECQPDTIVVASDHGMDAYDGRFRINDFLRNEGYVESVQGGTGMPTWAKIRDGQLIDGDEGTSRDRTWIERIMEGAATLGITSQRVGRVIERLGVEEHVMEIVPNDVIRAASEQVDFENSTAYMRSRIECGIRINLEGREPSGTVPRDQYESVRSDLISVLRTATTPDGKPIFEDVAPREEYFDGPYVEDAVDIVTIPDDFRYYVTTWLLGEEFETPDGPAWDHVRRGIVAAGGEGIDESRTIGDAHLFDVAPTVLATLDVPVSDRMDGSSLPIVEPTEESTYPTPSGPVETTTSSDVEERLSDLGYIE